jgi:hypothetical protein
MGIAHLQGDRRRRNHLLELAPLLLVRETAVWVYVCRVGVSSAGQLVKAQSAKRLTVASFIGPPLGRERVQPGFVGHMRLGLRVKELLWRSAESVRCLSA